MMKASDRYTKLSHRANAGTTHAALCGKKPPRGRPWKKAPEGKQMCQKCDEIYFALRAPFWLAA